MGMRLCLMLLLTTASVAVCVSDRHSSTNFQTSNITQVVPLYFRRLYEKWSMNSECNDEEVKSSQADFRVRCAHRFSLRARIPKFEASNLIKSDIRIEFYNVKRSKKVSSHNYNVTISPMDTAIDSDVQPIQDINVNGSLVDLSFNVTKIVIKSLELGKKNINLRLNVQRKLKAANELKSNTSSAFLIVHVSDNTCRLNTINISSFGRTMGVIPHMNKKSPRQLTKSIGKQYPFANPCRLKKWKVYIEDTDFDKSIVYPTVINANSCGGNCLFPLRGINTTDYAFLKAYMHHTDSSIEPPCCVPQSFAPAPFIFYDRMSNSFTITDRPNLVAKSCACL